MLRRSHLRDVAYERTIMAKINKTNAARMLDREKVDYQLIPYEVSGEHLSAGEVAGQLGENASLVFKTLVLTGDRNGIVICVVPGDAELDLKAAAKASANKKVEMLPLKELLSVTGYVRGGCSPIGMKNTSRRLSTGQLLIMIGYM